MITDINKTVRELALKSGVGVIALGRLAGIHKSAVSRFLSGERGLSADALVRLADALGHEVIIRKRRER